MDRERTIVKYMPLVESVAETLTRNGIPRHYRDDLVSEGTVAMILVIDGPPPGIPIEQRIRRRVRDAMLRFWYREAKHVPFGESLEPAEVDDDCPPAALPLGVPGLAMVDGEDDYSEESYP